MTDLIPMGEAMARIGELEADNVRLKLENGHLRSRANTVLGWCKVDGKESVLTAPVIDILESTIKVTRNE